MRLHVVQTSGIPPDSIVSAGNLLRAVLSVDNPLRQLLCQVNTNANSFDSQMSSRDSLTLECIALIVNYLVF